MTLIGSENALLCAISGSGRIEIAMWGSASHESGCGSIERNSDYCSRL